MENNNPNSSKRFRNSNRHKRAIENVNREKGLEYRTKNGKIKPGKTFNRIFCECLRTCHLSVDETAQKQIHKTFYNLPSWMDKTSFIIIINTSQRKFARREESQNFGKI